MGHGTSSSGAAVTYYYVGMKDLKLDPHFSIRRKVDGEYVEEKARFISGYVQDMKVEDVEIPINGKKKKVKQIKTRIYDSTSKSVYLLDCMFSQVSRELINRLASAETLKRETKFTLWKDDQGYAKMSVRQQNPATDEWEVLKSKYGYKDHLVKYIKEVTVNGETVKDYSKLDAQLTKVIEEGIMKLERLQTAVESSSGISAPANLTPLKEALEKPAPSQEEEETDLPF
jgi:hypothetical protein